MRRPCGVVSVTGVDGGGGGQERGMCGNGPGDPVLKSLACNAGDLGLIPGPGTKIPHASEKVSPLATITEPTGYN